MLTGTEIAKAGLITPCLPQTKCRYSYGIEPFGYTLRLGNEYISKGVKLSTDAPFLLYPAEHILVSTLETVALDNTVTGLLYGKSSFTRQGLFYSFGVVDAGYSGSLSFSIFNASHLPITLVPSQGIAQITIFKSEAPTNTPYSGRYNNSTGVTPVLNG